VIPANTAAQGGKSPAEIVREQLGLYMGAFTSRNAVQLTTKQCFPGTAADDLTLAQIPVLLDALGPMLRTLLGKAGADKVIGEVKWKLGL
jgi:hypothetical protein